ncbi:hypothetical protein AB6A40_010388 [Gnathostoma spinigerum]|uniref:Transmembrane protein n=1 Tax=Gnathostoma spinigerum TaxID=75299 RepID=A0ABD6EZL8_9BILA
MLSILCFLTPAVVTVSDLLYIGLCVFATVLALISFLLLLAVKKQRKELLLPYVFYAVLCALASIVVIFMCIWALTSSRSTPSKKLLRMLKNNDELHDGFESVFGDFEDELQQWRVSHIDCSGALLIHYQLSPAKLFHNRFEEQC